MTDKDSTESRRAPRVPLEPDECELSFIVEEDYLHVLEANLSDTGIGFTTRYPLKVMLSMKFGERQENKTANLVWVKKNEDQTMNYGFAFEEKGTPGK